MKGNSKKEEAAPRSEYFEEKRGLYKLSAYVPAQTSVITYADAQILLSLIAF